MTALGSLSSAAAEDTGTDSAVWAGRLAGLGLAAMAVAPWPVVYLDVTGNGQLSAFTHTISDHVNAPGGPALLTVTAACGLVAGLALMAGMRAAALHGRTGIQVLMGSWCLAVVIAGVFPTNAMGTPPDLAAGVHRYAVGWMIAVLPLAGWLLARRSREQPRWRSSAPLVGVLAVATGVSSAAFLLSHIPIVFPGSPGVVMLGVVERVLFGMDIVLLAAGLLAVRRAARSTGGGL